MDPPPTRRTIHQSPPSMLVDGTLPAAAAMEARASTGPREQGDADAAGARVHPLRLPRRPRKLELRRPSPHKLMTLLASRTANASSFSKTSVSLLGTSEGPAVPLILTPFKQPCNGFVHVTTWNHLISILLVCILLVEDGWWPMETPLSPRKSTMCVQQLKQTCLLLLLLPSPDKGIQVSVKSSANSLSTSPSSCLDSGYTAPQRCLQIPSGELQSTTHSARLLVVGKSYLRSPCQPVVVFILSCSDAICSFLLLLITIFECCFPSGMQLVVICSYCLLFVL
ncbi:uncharacterized protein [Lolium perenne]|uniref:uncharacterized protein isoform X4 n=1 Tax=Lolium perenne TaxID=4522 RepID=UPI003A9A0403